MGDSKHLRKKYSTPRHPWERSRLGEEKDFRFQYGTKNKKEMWKLKSKLDGFREQGKRATKARTKQEQKEAQDVLARARRYGLIGSDDGVGALLGLQSKDIMERRLQTLVFRKGLARTVKQSRQMIVHRHISIDSKVITSPNYLVTLEEEPQLQYKATSVFVDEDHPERKEPEKAPVVEEKTEEKEQLPEVKDEVNKAPTEKATEAVEKKVVEAPKA